MILAITTYPLSHSFKQQLEQTHKAVINYFLLRELQALSTLQLLKKLRSLNTTKLLIPLEDTNSKALLPLMLLVAMLIKKSSIEIVYPNLQHKKISFWQSINAIIGFIWSTIAVHITLWRCTYQMGKLLQLERINSTNNSHQNVLYLNANLWFGIKAGGSVGHVAGVMNALSKKNYQIYYAAVDKNSLMAPSISFEVLQPPKTFGMPIELNYYRFNLQVCKQLLQSFPSLPIKFIYQRMSIANYTGVLLARHFKVPLIIEYNGSEAWVAKNWGRPLRYHQQAVMAEAVCLKYAKIIVTISAVLRDELIERGVDAERIVCYPNCIDPEIFNPDRFSQEELINLRKNHNIPADAIVLTFVGTFGIWHGVDILAQTIRYLVDHSEEWLVKNKVHWLLVGDGAKMSEVKTILSDKKYYRFVTLTGLIPQYKAPKYLAASDILLSPHIANADGSRFFGSPTKLFEYMAMGKSIIASDLEQIGEVLKNSLSITMLPLQLPQTTQKELAVLCSPGKSSDLVSAIQFLVEQPQWRNILGKNARKEALSKYTWEQHVNTFLQKLNNNPTDKEF